MARLLVLRHAKSSWAEQGQDDHDRPLNKRGRSDAPVIAERLVVAGWAPDRVFCSTAQRTRETWSLMAPSFSATVEYLRELYLAPPATLLATAMGHEGTVAVIAHNPGCESLVSALAGHPVQFTTCNAAMLSAPSWDGPWTLEGLFRPREPRGTS